MHFAFVTVQVKHMEKSIAFYHDVLGLEINTCHPLGDGGEMAMLGDSNQPNIELLCTPQGNAPMHSGYSIGIAVSNLEEATARLEAAGYPKTRGPLSPQPGVSFSFFRDPDGIEIQLIEQA